MVSRATDQFIDRIYEAAVVPEVWPRVLADLTTLAEGAFASVFVQRNGDIRWVGTPEAEVLIHDYVALNDPNFNSRFPRMLLSQHAGFIHDLDVFTEAEIAADDFYQHFMRPRGYGWVTSRHIIPPTGELIVISTERHTARGPFEPHIIARLDELGPHVARAGLLAARLNFNRGVAFAEILQSIGLPGAVLSGGGRLSATNALFEALMPARRRIGATG